MAKLETISKCFYVDVNLKGKFFPSRAMRVINRDSSRKPWNRQKHFDAFVHRKKNESLTLKDQI